MTKASLMEAAREHLKQVYSQLVVQEINYREIGLLHLHAYPTDWKKRSPEEKKKWLDAKQKQFKVLTTPLKTSIKAIEDYIESLEEKKVEKKKGSKKKKG